MFTLSGAFSLSLSSFVCVYDGADYPSGLARTGRELRTRPGPFSLFLFLSHVLGICIVPWGYGSRSLSVAGVGVVSQMPDRNGWRVSGAASNNNI